MNGFYKTQPFPTGASFCMVIVDYSPAGLAQCNFPGNPLTDEYGPAAIPGNTVKQPDPGDEPVERLADQRAPESAAHGYGQYLVYGGAGGGGNFGYPPSAYSPQTHTYYACLQNQSGAHANQGPNTYERDDDRRSR